MGKIRVLDDSLISLISAGEVIENPASIVKELIENSLDAGATNIEITLSDGGIKSLVVSDNGSGILREDCEICLQRYSTSKIKSRDDIDAILTYGFRGEALASISSMANITITTCHNDEEIGTRLVSRIGGEQGIFDASRPKGTSVEVRDLFGSVPARRKHLSEARVEAQRVHETVMRHAIIRNETGFKLIRDGDVIVDCPSDQSPRDRVLSLWGTDLARNLEEFRTEDKGLIISGFIVKPPISRGNRSREYFSVRKRPIQENRLSIAVERAYSTLLMKGQFPICSIDIEVDVSRVDANVHPTKREVRIQDLEEIAEIIILAIRKLLGTARTEETQQPLQDFTKIEETRSHGSTPPKTAVVRDHELFEETTLEGVPLAEDMELDFLGGSFRILGQVNELYLILAFEDGLVIVDQHAAHERILYERLREDVNNGTVIVQELLEPFVLHLNSKDIEEILSVSETLEEIGFTISSFGGKELLVSTLPEILGRRATTNEILTLVDRMLEIGVKSAKEQFMDALVKVTACHSAIRSGQTLSHEEIRELLVDLTSTPNLYNCAHGRPSLIRIDRKELDHRFGRDGPEALERFRARHGLK
ncbi:MAG: DNA mismatch repair endonuclease MutL [Candidatus Thorarchaeota archaeon]